MLTLADDAREHVDRCEDCRLKRWERGMSAVEARRLCRVNADPAPRPFVIVFIAGERASVPGVRRVIARESSYETAEAKAREWNAAPADLAYGHFAVEWQP